MIITGAKDVKNCSNSSGRRFSNIRIPDIANCDLLISEVILNIKKDRQPSQSSVFFD